MVSGTIKSGNKELIYNCNFITYNEEPCEVTFNYENVDFLFKFIFIKDDKKKEASFSMKDEGPTFILELTNFNSSFGHGNINPINPGKVGEKPLFFRYWISKPGSERESRRIELSVFIGEAENGL
jgi:hypothetical protein